MEITRFLHGLALNAELLNFVAGPKARFNAYKNVLTQLNSTSTGQKLYNTPIDGDLTAPIEVSLGWLNLETIEALWKISNIRVIHAPFLHGHISKVASGKKYFVDITDKGEKNRLVWLLKQIITIKPGPAPVTIIFHPQPVDKNKTKDEIVKNMLHVFRPVCGLIQKYNIYLTIENLPMLTGEYAMQTNTLGTWHLFEDFFASCKCPNIGITFDFGHANTMARFLWKQYGYSKDYLINFEFQKYFVDKLGNKIYHVHFHYNPAHVLEYKSPLLKLNKFKNFDFHDSVTKYSKLQAKNISSIIKQITFPKLTTTIEVVPRSVSSVKAYEKDVLWFSENIMVE